MTPSDDFEVNSASELSGLREQIVYLQEALSAISSGGVDAVVIAEPEGEQIYTLTSADRPYRVIVEEMGEGAATVSENGVILFANPQLANFLGVERDSMIGRDLAEYVAKDQRSALASLLVASSEMTRRAELVLTGGERTNVPFLVSSTDIDLDGVLVRCLVLTELTMQKMIEKQMAADVAQIERQRVAAEVNDTIVQGLVAAEMALDLDQVGYARSLIAATSKRARNWIGELAGDQELAPGMAVRRSPAQRLAGP
jgi:PAS domain S-box-containing protein